MRAYCSRLMQSDEGSGTMACVMLIALAAALIATVASVGGALLCRSRARSAADATALSAASAYWSGGASDPCAVGRRAAAENDAQLESCAVEGDDIVVTCPCRCACHSCHVSASVPAPGPSAVNSR